MPRIPTIKLDTTSHTIKLGRFYYKHTEERKPLELKITKITKCFVFFYMPIYNRIESFKNKIKYDEANGWYFTADDENVYVDLPKFCKTYDGTNYTSLDKTNVGK